LRCLPLGLNVDTAYGDSKCTQRVARGGACVASPKFVLDQSVQCATDVYAIGANLGPLATIYSNPNCTGSPETSGATWYALGAKQDPTAFVKGTLVREDRGAGIQMQFTVGDDGSREPTMPYDTTRKGSCDASEIAFTPNADRCLPQRVAFFEEQYTDLGCGMKAAVYPALGCNPPTDEVLSAAWVYEIVQCQGAMVSTVSNVGAKSTGPLYRGTPTACGVDTNAPPSWYPVTTAIDATSLPALSLARDGTGRVVTSWRVSSTQAHLYVASFYDTQQNIACQPRKASDATLRCVPDIPSINPYYSDDKCTTPVLGWGQQPSCPPTSPASTYLLEKWNGCETQYGHAALGAKLPTPTTLYQWDGNAQSCTSTGFDPQEDYYALTVTDPTTFAALTDVRE
jgi:hypothetical protein